MLASGSTAVVDAECAGTECHDLEHAASHHHVLDEMEYLVRIGEVGVEEHRGGDAEQREDAAGGARPIADDHQDAAADLDRNSADVSKWCGKRKRGRVDQ